MNTKHLERIIEISKELVDMKDYSSRWRATLRTRFDEDNGTSWVRYLRNHFDTEKVFKDIKKDSTVLDVHAILVKRSIHG